MNETPPVVAAPLPPGGAAPAARRSRFRGASLKVLASLAWCVAVMPAQADAVDTLREFVRDVKTGQSTFTQVVTSADGTRKKTSSGDFEFARPNRFRFNYSKPFQQLIVADGVKVWIFDADLNQASSRRIAQAIGSTPAALLSGASLEPEFMLSPEPAREGLDWALAMPRAKDGAFQSMRVGFRGKDLAAVEIIDSFGQRSRLDFQRFTANPPTAADRFRFVPPAGADVIEQ